MMRCGVLKIRQPRMENVRDMTDLEFKGISESTPVDCDQACQESLIT